jgi:hypothetical protein
MELILIKPKRTSKCKVCRAEFIKRSMSHKVCSPECSEKHVSIVAAKAAMIAAKKQAAADRAKLETFKSIPDLKADAQVAFNAYIRARDADLPCICCDKWNQSEALTGGAFDAGHYRSRGSADHLRYNENNVHKQLKSCNRYASGNAVEYRLGLIKRIGLPFVEALEADQKVVKWTREMLLEIKMTYRAKLKALQH